MLGLGWARSGCLAFAALGLIVLTHCSSPADDGGSCSKDSGCSSNRCVNGTCEGSDCQCDGADCRGQSTCLAGWLCTRGDAVNTGDVLPQCRKQCVNVGDCSSDKHCANGVCRLGPEPFLLTWVSFPRTVPCAPKVPCKYEVKVTTTIDKFTWTFGTTPPSTMDTTDPTTEFTYPMSGTFDVSVHAVATSGAFADLTASETLCEGALGAACDLSGAPCCAGRCGVTNKCQ